ncbi:MAG TPA: hypothetical protein VF006_13045 [Longimicrobium sp.]
MSWLRRRTEGALCAALLLTATSCMDQGELFGPDPEPSGDAPRVRLGAPSYVLYEGDEVRVRVEGLDGRTGQAEVLVLDRAREVVWRSGRVAATDTLARVPVTGLPQQLFADTALSLSAVVEVGDVRVYAGDDTAAVLSRNQAALRPVRFYPGEVVALDAGRPQSFALDAATGRLYFAASDRARIGVIDLATRRETAGVDVPTGPVALRFLGGRLGALIADGTELAVFEAGPGLEFRERILLPTLVLDVQTLRVAADSASPAQVDTLSAVVRPYARGLAWGCPDAGCSSPVAFTASRLAGADPAKATAAMRRVVLGAGAPVAPVVVPGYQPGVLPSDTTPSRVRVFAARQSGADSLVFDRADRMRCPTAMLGGAAFDVAAGGPAVLYAAVEGELACGDGTRLMRIDQAASDDPRFSALARRNLLGEDRVGAVAEVRVSPDAQLVLVRAEDRVHLFDADLRLRATLEVADPTAVAWVEGGPVASLYFAVASAEGVALYDTVRRVVVTRFPLGPTRESLLAVWRTGQELVAAAGPLDRDGVVTARVPVP